MRSKRGKGRFCAGKEFGQYHLDPGKGGKDLRAGEVPGPRVRLEYGGGLEFLHENEVHMFNVGREINKTQWILYQKIYIVGALVDEIEKMYPWSTTSPENVRWFNQNTGTTQEFLDEWLDILGGLLKQQKVSLTGMTTAEMTNERNKHEQRVQIAEILRKPETEITAEDTEIITSRVVAKEVPSGSSSRPVYKKGPTVEDDVRTRKGIHRAAPAVVRQIAKAFPAYPPRRPTPPIGPPAKWLKGVSKGAAERAPSGSRPGKGKGTRGEKGQSQDGPRAWSRPPENQGFGHLPPAPQRPARFEPPDRAMQVPIRRNTIRDVREIDRERRERVEEPPNAAYLAWHDAAWVGQSPAPHADDRDDGWNHNRRAEDHSRSGGRTPTLRLVPFRQGRQRTRSPVRRPPDNRDEGPYHHVDPYRDRHDWGEDDWYDQKIQSQERRNREFQRERRS